MQNIKHANQQYNSVCHSPIENITVKIIDQVSYYRNIFS